MSQKQCPCPEAKSGECCNHCLILSKDDDCKPVDPRAASFFPAPVESPLYAVESGDEVRPIVNGW